MKGPRSLQLQLALALGLAVTAMWLVATVITAQRLRNELDAEFNNALNEAAHRLQPLVGHHGTERPDRGRDDDDHYEREDHDDDEITVSEFSYVIYDEAGQVVLSSGTADLSVFPPFDKEGFIQTETHTLFYDRYRRGNSVYIVAVAEPLSYRAAAARELALSLSMPLLAVIPLSLVAIFLLVRHSLAPMRLLRGDLEDRSAYNLTPLEDRGVPSELVPVVNSVNDLLHRLNAAFEAERSFAANAAHELRTPVAGAIAQAQRLQVETDDPSAAVRAGDIQNTLKRLNSLSEKLMQLARAEGGRLRTDGSVDLRVILKMVVDDFARLGSDDRFELCLPDQPVLSDLDPDAFGILTRNLVENALKHGDHNKPVSVTLTSSCELIVANAGPIVAPTDLEQLTARFARRNGKVEGSGLGLAIVQTIVGRTDARLALKSPATGQQEGFEVCITFPQVD